MRGLMNELMPGASEEEVEQAAYEVAGFLSSIWAVAERIVNERHAHDHGTVEGQKGLDAGGHARRHRGSE